MGRSITFLSHFMQWPQVLCLQSKKIVNLGTSQNIFPFHLSLCFQRIIKTPSMMRFLLFLISQHLVARRLNPLCTSQMLSCHGSHVRHCHTYSYFCLAVNPSGVGGVHPRAHPPHTSLCHLWTFLFTSAPLAPKSLHQRNRLSCPILQHHFNKI